MPSPGSPHECDVLVVGGGNAGFSAAVAAKQGGAGRVVLIDKCPKEWAGGNSCSWRHEGLVARCQQCHG